MDMSELRANTMMSLLDWQLAAILAVAIAVVVTIVGWVWAKIDEELEQIKKIADDA